MAKFWAAIRKVIHNIPIPGVGISINDAKAVYQGMTVSPGGTIVYEPPVTPTPEADLVSGVEIRQYNLWLWVAVALAVYLMFFKD